MKKTAFSKPSFEFYFPDVDTLVQVEVEVDEVTIRATRNNLSSRRKMLFVRHLAAEGFIADRYQWFSGADSDWSHVRWLQDASWVRLPQAKIARTGKFMVRLLISAALLWGGMAILILTLGHPL